MRGSGRVGRSAAGRALSEGAVISAVVASVRHVDTPYDRLLMTGVPRQEARRRIAAGVEAVLRQWRDRTADSGPLPAPGPLPAQVRARAWPPSTSDGRVEADAQ